jgi:hypothetical protein
LVHIGPHGPVPAPTNALFSPLRDLREQPRDVDDAAVMDERQAILDEPAAMQSRWAHDPLAPTESPSALARTA